MFGQCFASCCCSLCGGKSQSAAGSKLAHILTIGIAFLIIEFMRWWGIDAIRYGLDKVNTKCPSQVCEPTGFVLRATFSLFIWHAVLSVFAFTEYGKIVCRQGIAVQLLAVVAFFIGSCWFPDGSMEGWSKFACAASIFYIIIQGMLYIDFTYKINEKFVPSISNEDGEMNKCAIYMMFGLCIGAIIASFTFLGLFISWYPSANATFFIGLTYGLSIFVFFLQSGISIKYGTSANIISTSMVISYATFLVFAAAVYAEDDSGKIVGSKQSQTWVQVLSSLLMVCTLLYCGTQASETVEQEKEKSEELVAKTEEEVEEGQDVEDKEAISSETAPAQKSADRSEACFHIMMAFTIAFAAMLFTNWNTGGKSLGKMNFWINATSQWIYFALYIWVLSIPVVCPHRFDSTDLI
jgi:hypothetical protein